MDRDGDEMTRTHEPAPRPSPSAAATDEGKLEAFLGLVVQEVGAAYNTVLTAIGDELGLYKVLAQAGPMSSTELAARSGTHERYVREWANAQAASGFLRYDAATETYELPPEQAFVLADDTSPVGLAGSPGGAGGGEHDPAHRGGLPHRTGSGLGRIRPPAVRGNRASFPVGLPREPGLRVDSRPGGRGGQAAGRYPRRRCGLRSRRVNDPARGGIPELDVRGLRLPPGLHRRGAAARRRRGAAPASGVVRGCCRRRVPGHLRCRRHLRRAARHGRPRRRSPPRAPVPHAGRHAHALRARRRGHRVRQPQPRRSPVLRDLHHGLHPGVVGPIRSHGPGRPGRAGPARGRSSRAPASAASAKPRGRRSTLSSKPVPDRSTNPGTTSAPGSRRSPPDPRSAHGRTAQQRSIDVEGPVIGQEPSRVEVDVAERAQAGVRRWTTGASDRAERPISALLSEQHAGHDAGSGGPRLVVDGEGVDDNVENARTAEPRRVSPGSIQEKTGSSSNAAASAELTAGASDGVALRRGCGVVRRRSWPSLLGCGAGEGAGGSRLGAGAANPLSACCRCRGPGKRALHGGRVSDHGNAGGSGRPCTDSPLR